MTPTKPPFTITLDDGTEWFPIGLQAASSSLLWIPVGTPIMNIPIDGSDPTESDSVNDQVILP